MKHFSMVLVILLAILLTTMAVSAAPPERSGSSFENDRLLETCDGYDLRLYVTGTFSVTTYFDKDGNRIREREHTDYTHFIYREGDQSFGLSESTSDNSQTWFDPTTGEVISGHYSGTPWNIHIPGVGPVFKISGPAFFVDDIGNFVKEAGHYTYDGEALCEYFAG